LEINKMAKINKSRTLLIIPATCRPAEYPIGIVRKIGKNHKIVYITLSKSYEFLSVLFKKNNLSTEKISFIDCVSSFIKQPRKTTNAEFVEAPYDLDAICASLKKIISEDCMVIFDSLSTLMNYGMEVPVGAGVLNNFVNCFSKILKEKRGKIVFVLEKSDEKNDLIKESKKLFEDQIML